MHSIPATFSIPRNIVPILAAIAVVMFLFWIDEGYYDFRWMSSWGNWLMFLIYTGGLVLGELLANNVLSERYAGAKRTTMIIAIGIPLGIVIVLAGIFSLGLVLRLLS